MLNPFLVCIRSVSDPNVSFLDGVRDRLNLPLDDSGTNLGMITTWDLTIMVCILNTIIRIQWK